MAEIFISHIHEEALAAGGLKRFLTRFGLESFLSSEDWRLKLGEQWFERITQELQSARIVILMLSPTSVDRPWINFEAGWAWSQSKVIIPACFGGLRVGTGMPKPYSDLDGVELESGYSRLVNTCFSHLRKSDLPDLPTSDDITDLLNALAGIGPTIKFL